MFYARPRMVWKVMSLALLALVTWPALATAAGIGSPGLASPRGGAGLRVGTWSVQDLPTDPSGSSWESVTVEGWFQKGLDQHLVIENTLGFWQRSQSATEDTGFGQIEWKTETYVVPMTTALKVYPMSQGSTPFEPYLLAGVGAVLGIDRASATSTDPLVVPADETRVRTGLAIQTGAGLELRTASPFGVMVGARYQWASFAEDVGGKGLYRGPGVTAGITYRFQH